MWPFETILRTEYILQKPDSFTVLFSEVTNSKQFLLLMNTWKTHNLKTKIPLQQKYISAHSTYLAYTDQQSKLAIITINTGITVGSRLAVSSVRGYDGFQTLVGIVFTWNSQPAQDLLWTKDFYISLFSPYGFKPYPTLVINTIWRKPSLIILYTEKCWKRLSQNSENVF